MQTPAQDVIVNHRERLKEPRRLRHGTRDTTAIARTHAGISVTIGARAEARGIRFDPPLSTA
ncbi:hypothetical protein [Actinoallomurus sp. CA-150999]|uniref:hypothetical protein n=1 Tax=Actinoallomurus sp. CA-150999 TaxID=3239887 RepID=UPI003D8C8616